MVSLSPIYYSFSVTQALSYLRPQDFRVGITLPGVAGLIMGRTGHMAFGFTYGFIDTIDFFVEEVQTTTSVV
jgi:hypothetical protein